MAGDFEFAADLSVPTIAYWNGKEWQGSPALDDARQSQVRSETSWRWLNRCSWLPWELRSTLVPSTLWWTRPPQTLRLDAAIRRPIVFRFAVGSCTVARVRFRMAPIADCCNTDQWEWVKEAPVFRNKASYCLWVKALLVDAGLHRVWVGGNFATGTQVSMERKGETEGNRGRQRETEGNRGKQREFCGI